MKKLYSRGFTLIELLVVIAIIGILSAVVLTSLGTARSKARIASAQQTLHGLQAAANICMNDSAAVVTPTNTQNGGNVTLCSTATATYVNLPTGWVYCSDTACASAASTSARFGQTTGSNFRIVAGSSADNATVMCTENTCYQY